MTSRFKYIIPFALLLIYFLFQAQSFGQTSYKFSDVVGIRLDSCNSFTIDSVVYTKFDMSKISGVLNLREIFKGDTAAACEGLHEYSIEFIDGKPNGYLKHFRYDRGNKLLVDESNYRNGQLHGSVKHWSLSGQLIFSGSYSQGLKNGKFSTYGFDGKFVTEEYYSNGVPNGRFRSWDAAGKLVSDEMKIPNEPDMIAVEGGSFQMGSARGHIDETPVHNVMISKFKISRFEITQNQWRSIMISNPSENISCGECPVENVSWSQVSEYIKLLNEVTGKNYRLPTEAEWEFAALGGVKKSAMNKFDSITIEKKAWVEFNSQGETHKVGMKLPNEIGVYDMYGNVSEFCSDWYSRYSKSSSVNPKGPLSGESKVVRGSNFQTNVEFQRASYRYEINPKFPNKKVGIRLVLTIE